jgi:uncharacterized protein YeaO (DUF488 family)
VYDPVDLWSDGFRILIMRKWLRGIGYKKHSIHKWSKELGPSRQLLDKWNRNEIAWGDYVTQYSAEQPWSVAAKIETESIAKCLYTNLLPCCAWSEKTIHTATDTS